MGKNPPPNAGDEVRSLVRELRSLCCRAAEPMQCISRSLHAAAKTQQSPKRRGAGKGEDQGFLSGFGLNDSSKERVIRNTRRAGMRAGMLLDTLSFSGDSVNLPGCRTDI